MTDRLLAIRHSQSISTLLFAFAALIAAFQVLPAAAHGPASLNVTETVEIKIPADAVWKRIGDFQDLSWHPAIHSLTGKGGNALKATRRLDLGNGATIDEMLSKYSAKNMSYSYRIAKVDTAVLPVRNYSSHLSVKPTGDRHALVEWHGDFNPGDPGNDAAAIAAVTTIYRGGLDALKKALEAGH